MPWPTKIPPDLRRLLDGVLGTRDRPLAADVWTDLREWLIRHGVEPPEVLPMEEEDGDALRDQWQDPG